MHQLATTGAATTIITKEGRRRRRRRQRVSHVRVRPAAARRGVPSSMLLALFSLSFFAGAARAALPSPTWPLTDAPRILMVRKAAGFELDKEPSWMHLHAGSGNAANVTLTVVCYVQGGDPCAGPSKIRYSEKPLLLGGSEGCRDQGGRGGSNDRGRGG